MRRVQWALLATAGLCTIGFIVLALCAQAGLLAGFDNSGLWAARSVETAKLDAIVPNLTNVGEAAYIAAVAIVIGAIFAVRRDWARAALVVAGVGGAEVLNIVLKHIADRTRPELWTHLVNETSQSFPSGHATASAALALCIVAIAWHSRWRIAAIVGAIIYVAVVAFTRLYLGVHYPSDILAGWLCAAAWVSLVIALIVMWRTRQSSKLD